MFCPHHVIERPFGGEGIRTGRRAVYDDEIAREAVAGGTDLNAWDVLKHGAVERIAIVEAPASADEDARHARPPAVRGRAGNTVTV